MSIFKEVEQMIESNAAGVLCNVISRNGSTPRQTGSKMPVVYTTGQITGTVEVDCVQEKTSRIGN